MTPPSERLLRHHARSRFFYRLDDTLSELKAIPPVRADLFDIARRHAEEITGVEENVWSTAAQRTRSLNPIYFVQRLLKGEATIFRNHAVKQGEKAIPKIRAIFERDKNKYDPGQWNDIHHALDAVFPSS